MSNQMMDPEGVPEPEENLDCPAVGYQAVTVSVPVTVTPYAKTGATTTKCCGTPIIKSGATKGEGTVNGVCNFSIGQNIVVAIPVAFGADATVGETYVDSIGASADEILCEELPTLSEPMGPSEPPAPPEA